LFSLVGAAHYHRPQTPIPHQNSLNDAVVHSFENVHSSDRRASVQSLETIFSSPAPSTSKSSPRLQQYLTRQLSSPAPPFFSSTTLSLSKYQNITLYPNLNRTDTSHSEQVSLSKTRTPDENVHFLNTKSLDEGVIATNLPNQITTMKSEPIEIRVRCIFSRVGEIDTLNERYTAEIFFEASWYDQDQKIGSKYDPQMGHFNPQLVVLNHIGDSLRHEVKKNVLTKLNDFFF
jgi:hypothetical protein